METVDVKFDANQSKYAKRLPVGTEEVVMNFKPEELRNYYHKWYRPDLQGIIIVGDGDQIESRLKTVFAACNLF